MAVHMAFLGGSERFAAWPLCSDVCARLRLAPLTGPSPNTAVEGLRAFLAGHARIVFDCGTKNDPAAVAAIGLCLLIAGWQMNAAQLGESLIQAGLLGCLLRVTKGSKDHTAGLNHGVTLSSLNFIRQISCLPCIRLWRL